MVLQEGQKLGFVVLAGFHVAQRVTLVRVDLQLVGFVRLDQSIDEL